MTDDEKRQQKAMLLLEYQEAEIHLSELREKARRIAGSLRSILSWLERAYSHSYDFKPEQPLYSDGAHVRILEETRFREAMNFEEMANLAQQVKDAQARLRDLGNRKQVLGLK